MIPPPTIPPPTAGSANAPLKIATKAGPIFPAFTTTTAIAPTIYATAMNGTSFSVTAATRFNPPRIMKPAKNINTIPVAAGATLNAAFMLLAIELIWLMLPIPNEARIQKTANNTASTFPIVLQPFLAPRPSLK